MKLGYKTGFQRPRCPTCNKYMHDPVQSMADLCWTFEHCGTYWEVTYVKQGRKYVLN